MSQTFTLPDPSPLSGKWMDYSVVALDNNPNGTDIALNTFVEIVDGGRRFLAQQTGLTAHCWRSYGLEDKVTLEIMRQAQIDPRRAEGMTDDKINFHPLTLAGEIVDNSLTMVRARPNPGASVAKMPAEATASLLRLPIGPDAFRIGAAADLPISLDRRTLLHHGLIAGATGSGKTTLVRQLIRGALMLGGSVVVFDHKPDYSEIGDLEGNARLALGSHNDLIALEQLVSVPSSSLDAVLLARTLFYRPSDHNQAECALLSLDMYAEENKGRIWSLRDFRTWLQDDNTKGRLINSEGVNKSTLSATTRKLGSSLRKPPFVDADINRMTGAPKETFNFADIMRPNRVTVIRLTEAVQDTRGYALFIDYLMSRHSEYRAKEDPRTRQFLLCIIDEAQDIFSGTKEFREAAEHTLQKSIRKGRSLNTSIIVVPQSASCVPDQIMNNLNTRLVFRHNDADEAKQALIQATDQQRKMTEQLQPGECLGSIFGTRMVFEIRIDNIGLALQPIGPDA